MNNIIDIFKTPIYMKKLNLDLSYYEKKVFYLKKNIHQERKVI